jgi:hypothetical protein
MSTFKRAGVSNLDLHVATGTYYARIKKGGNTLRRAVGSNKQAAIYAKETWLKELRGSPSRVAGTLGSLVEKHHIWLNEQLVLKEISERTRDYKLELLAAIRWHWTQFDKLPMGDFTKPIVRCFKIEMLKHYAPPRTNGAITVLREIMRLAVENNMLSSAQREALLEDVTFARIG